MKEKGSRCFTDMAAASATTWRRDNPEKIKNVVGKYSYNKQTLAKINANNKAIRKCPSPCCTSELNLYPLVLLVIVATCKQKIAREMRNEAQSKTKT